MLKASTSTTITGTSTDSDNKLIATFNASIPGDGGQTNTNTYINDSAAYDANKVAVRKDLNDFMAKVYDVEDAVKAK